MILLGQANPLFWPLIAISVISLLLVIRSWRTRRRLLTLRRAVQQLTSSQKRQRIPTDGAGSIGGLSRELARMAAEFDERFRAMSQQRNEQQAVLSSMVEGVFAVDLDERILSLNRAAAELLNISPERAIGRSIQEVVRNSVVQQFVAEVLTVDMPRQSDLVLRLGDPSINGEDSERFLQAQGAVLTDASGVRIGAVIVLHDVTRLRRLEVVRRDFVANVSHEIKTPITAIKGAVETLVETAEVDADVARFLQIIHRQADRLHAIVEDLLSLARIEQDAEREQVRRDVVPMAEVLYAAIDTCSIQAESRDIQLHCEVPDGLAVWVNAALLEQAVVNLLDNAIKYSPEHTTVRLSALRQAQGVMIQVVDEGVGIESEHLPRLFERFYRTDRARSRAQGGTGLGLSIVKHIVNAHGGSVEVKSQIGQGSTFTIHLPGVLRDQPVLG